MTDKTLGQKGTAGACRGAVRLGAPLAGSERLGGDFRAYGRIYDVNSSGGRPTLGPHWRQVRHGAQTGPPIRVLARGPEAVRGSLAVLGYRRGGTT